MTPLGLIAWALAIAAAIVIVGFPAVLVAACWRAVTSREPEVLYAGGEEDA